MATMKACVQKMRSDGFFPVYIRVTHNRTTQYIKTDKMVTRRELSRSRDITDPVVMQFCTAWIQTIFLKKTSHNMRYLAGLFGYSTKI